jgi:hypothetical protein
MNSSQRSSGLAPVRFDLLGYFHERRKIERLDDEY